MKKFFNIVILGVFCFLMLGIWGITAKAATGSVTFGSTNYRWEGGSTNPIGIYISGDEAITSYDVTLTYDSTYLRYVSGATEVAGNNIYLRGNGKDAGYRHTLYFEVIKEGNTRIRAVSANAKTADKVISVSGNDVEKAKQDFEFTQLATAPIATSDLVSSMLAELSVIPDVLKDFSTEKLEYQLTVPFEVENLQVNYVLEDANATATLSDTVLAVGENEISLKVKGSTEETVYKLKVIREEKKVVEPTPTPTPSEESSAEVSTEQTEESKETMETIIEEVESSPAESVEETEPVSTMDKVSSIQKIVLWIAVAGVMVLMVVYFAKTIKQRLVENRITRIEQREVKVVNLESAVIRVKNVTMKFRMAKDESSSLKEYLIRAFKHQNEYTYFTALDNISFDVNQGDVVGIIGTNGSGKSTMLKIVSGAMKPTKGRVEVDQSKVQLLTLGTGFDMELTARENVFLNGSIIGYTREYIEEKYDDIVKFAELEGFMEERMKNFSSGMVSRLGFAIATMRDAPDILILDEVLSVGDMFFRKKSEERIKQMIHSGATVLIVSHSMDTIKKNCNKVVWIEKGVLQMVGDPKTVCDAYAKKNGE